MERITINMNQLWKFHRGDVINGSHRGLDDMAWRDVTLPHDWSVEEEFSTEHASGGGYLPGGIGWYRRTLDVPAHWQGRKVFITFDGVYNQAQVWVNSHNVGKRPFGYARFTFDITPYLEWGATDNVIVVRAHHEHTADSRWFTGSGIYRDVTLTVCDPVHVPEYGLFVTTPQVRDDAAIVQMQVDVANDTQMDQTVTVHTLLMDSEDIIAHTQEAITVSGESTKQITQQMYVDQPRRWSVDEPHLYTAICRLVRGDEIIDEVDTTMGIRSFHFDGDRGFFLNEQPMKLKGVCIHHDAGCLGAAVPPSVWRRRLQQLKDMGCNAIRMAHNPPAANLLDLCDQMGFLVMDEAFDEWEGYKNKWWQGHNVYPPKHYGYASDFPQWGQRDLQDMVKRDRNHPAIILWSIGNEIDYPNDPYCHPAFEEMTGNNDANKPAAERVYDRNKPHAQRLQSLARQLTRWVKDCDNTRPVTMALAFPELSNIIHVSDELDVVGYNYKEHLYADDHAQYPGRVIYGSENSSEAAQWLAVRDHDYICGQFIWTGIDYMGEAHGWPIRISPSGFLDLAGFDRPWYHYRKSLWTDAPMVYLATVTPEHPEGYMKRLMEQPTWAYDADEAIIVSCYTNCDQVELFINEVSQGVQTAAAFTDLYAQYTVNYQAGTLKAVGWKDGQSCECVLHTPGAGRILQTDILPTDDDVTAITFEMTDENGQRVCACDDRLAITIDGPGTLRGIENGDPRDVTSYAKSWRNLLRGRAIAYIRRDHADGDIQVHVQCGAIQQEHII